jgi:hypothetical protein
MSQQTVFGNQRIAYSRRAVAVGQRCERALNRWVRGRDRILGRLHLGGRKADYDDEAYEFLGGPSNRLRKKHYDKSLRLLWKAEAHAPWSSFRDCSRSERALVRQAIEGMSSEEQAVCSQLTDPEFRAMLKREYTLEERQAIVSILSAIGHGEAYAWLVSAELLPIVRSTGAKAALTAQVLEEAKHFVVLRELIQAFDVEVPRLCAWEYVLLERVFKSQGLDRLFGMNVIVESVALGIFGMLSTLPGLELLRLFHLDESRHTALPVNYFKEFPLSPWQRYGPTARLRRLNLLLPAIPLVFHFEADLAVLGVDTFEFGGSVIRKAARLMDRAGFTLPLPTSTVVSAVNALFNAYCLATRSGHTITDYRNAESTRGTRERAVEEDVFSTAVPAS